jgi:hypothetical protein
LMLLPYWTKGCIGSVEGVYFESSATAPFHWLTSAHISAPDTKNADGTKKYSGPSNPQRFLRYPPVGFPVAEFPKYFNTGVEKMQMEGVRYYVALTDLANTTAAAHPLLKRVGGSGPFNVYLVSGSELVAPLTDEPVVVTGIDQDQDGGWLDVQQEWFYGAGLNYPRNITFTGPKEWKRAKATVTKKVHNYGADTAMENPPPTPLKPVKISNIRRDNVNIEFNVDQIGVPVVVRSSFFPNWKATGAKGPYRIMPNFMVVIPTQTNVKLDYGYTGPDKLGYLATFLGLCGAALLGFRRRRDHSVDLAGYVDPANAAGEITAPESLEERTNPNTPTHTPMDTSTSIPMDTSVDTPTLLGDQPINTPTLLVNQPTVSEPTIQVEEDQSSDAVSSTNETPILTAESTTSDVEPRGRRWTDPT